jgi:Leucine-rich repeat (LRR) protein
VVARSPGDVASLEVLHLANNKLTHLPLDMSRLSRLQQLMINNNKVPYPPTYLHPHHTCLRACTH